MSISRSVIINTKDRFSDLRNCVESLLIQKVPLHELIVVDASTEEKSIKEMCANLLNGSSIIFKYIHTKAGNSYQRNVAISLLHSDSEFVFFLDDDVVLYEDTVQNTIEAFSKYGAAAAVCGVESNRIPQNILGKGVRKFFLIGHESNDWRLLFSGEHTEVIRPKNDIFVGSFKGCFNCVRREVLVNFRFDEWFVKYAFLEDYDFSFRISSSEFKILQTPFVRFIHTQSQISRLSKHETSKMYMENKAYFFKKNMPKTAKHFLAFYWSILGHLVLNFGKSIARRDEGYFFGTLAGAVKIIFLG